MSWSWSQRSVFFSFCFSFCFSLTSFCLLSQGSLATIDVPSWVKEEEEAHRCLECRFDLFLQHKKRTGVLVLCLEVHCPVGHLHVQAGYRFFHILCQSFRLLLHRHKVLQLVIRLRGQFEQHCHFLCNLWVRLISVSGSEDLVFGLDS